MPSQKSVSAGARVAKISRFSISLRSLLHSIRRDAQRFKTFYADQRLGMRIGTVLSLLVFFTAFAWQIAETKVAIDKYNIAPYDKILLDQPIGLYATTLKENAKTGQLEYNAGYTPGGGVTGDTASPKFTANFSSAPYYDTTVTDPVNNVSVVLRPKFRLDVPKKNENRVVYPIIGKSAAKVQTLYAAGIKEDILIYKTGLNKMEFSYELQLEDGLEARLESNGSVGIYGVRSELLGNVSTSTEEDANLLQQARQNGKKSQILFTIPAPQVFEVGRKVTNNVETRFELKDNVLTLVAEGLQDATFPLSIDPTIYVETAAKLMRGNNETNTDFDVSNELIQKSQTTGARIDAWQGNLDMSQGIWDHATAAAGGYIYRTGGTTGLSKPQIVSQQSTAQATNSTTFAMDMPSSRPAGDLYIALMCHDGTVTVSPPAGWTEYADTREHAAYYKVGTDQGGGNESASYTWTGSGSEQWYGVIIRVTNFNTADPISGTPATGSNASNAVPVFPATTPDSSATLVIRAAGADNDIPSTTGWVPSGHTKIDSGNSNSGNTGDTNDCGFAAASLDTPPATGVSSGTATLNDSSLNDTYGASSIAINPIGSIIQPQVQDVQETLQNTNSTSFVMNMPSTRPAGDLYVAIMCHDGSNGSGSPGGTGGNNITGPAGWTEYADLQGFAAYYKIGANISGGNEAASYTWTGNSENWAGVIMRITGFDSSDPVSGTPGTGFSTTNATPVFPATTPDTNNTLVIRAVGADNDEPSATAWVPAGHTKIASGGSTQANNDCAYVAASLDSPPLSGVSTGTATLGDGSINDDYGAASIAINANPTSTSSVTQSSLNWAKFNSSSRAIESPNPGAGVCSGWCTDATYNLPSARRGHTMVAYNGFLYVIGGLDSSGTRANTVYIAKLGANGEPSLWNPTDSNPDNWVYWYQSTNTLSTATSYAAAVAYNNRIYLLGGQTNSGTGGVTTVQIADLNPTGDLEGWTTVGTTALPTGAGLYMHSVQVYNNTLYTIGGFEGANTSSSNLRSAVWYNRLNDNGTMNTWVQTKSFTTARASYGGSFSTIWGAYIYMGGGCSAVNASGYCTTIANDTQIASINADGSLDDFSSMGSLDNARVGYSLIGWQGGLYRLGGCTEVNSSTGACNSTLADVDYGVVNPAGEVSTVNISEPSGTAPCSGGSPKNCDLPTVGDDAGEIGQMLTMTVVLNGYLYVIGGCAEYNCNDGANTPTNDNISSNTAYVAIASDGSLVAPPSCGGTSYGAWCVDSTNTINGADGVAAAGVTVFDGRIYIIGGIDSTAAQTGELYYNSVNPLTGALSGAWTTQTLSSVGIGTNVFYTYAYARSNPAQAGTYPGNLYLFGGCGNGGSGAGCGANDYRTEVYKCWIETGGAIENTAGSTTYDCTTSGQLQIDSTPGTGGADGLGIHSGTVYANYIYLIGGFSQAESDKDDVLYAKFDNNNNVVAVSGSDWIESPRKLSTGRRRGWAFGYNGHIYAVGGYDASGTGTIIPFIEWAKINVSDGSIDPFVTSTVTINQRWGLSMAVSNSYAYVVGGCNVGASPSSCSSFEPSIQTFQLYNNDSGAIADFTAQSDQTFATDTNRIGAAAAVYKGYLYVAGGCTVITCSTGQVTDNVQFAQLSASDGSVSTWNNTTDSTLPAVRAFGTLEVAGGTLYYMGGQDATGDEKNNVYYGTPDPTAGYNVSTWSSAANNLPADRTQHGSAVWNNRLYVVGGFDDSATASSTVYVSPQLNTGGNINSAWTSLTGFNVARAGAAVTAYANNLYLFGGFDGTNYLSDSQFTQINSDGTVDAWTYTTNLPFGFRDGKAISANGYIYVVTGRTASTTCNPKVLITPISANTTIATGNNPTGIGEWYETNVRYTGDRYGAAVAYDKGKLYTMGGGCSSVLSSNRHYYSTVKSQPQVAIYSRLIDTDSDVFPNSWLMNGLDNSIGARWQVRYKSAANGNAGGTALIFDEDYEQGTDGVQFDDNPVGGTTVDYDSCYENGTGQQEFDNAWAKGGVMSGRYYVPSGTGNTGCFNSFGTPISQRFERFYLKFDSTPSSNVNIYNVTNTTVGGGTRLAELRILSTGCTANDCPLQLRDEFIADGTNMTLTKGGDGNRIEVGLVGDHMIVRLYTGSNVDGYIPDQEQDISLDNAATDLFNQITIGVITSVNSVFNLWVDEHKAATDNWVGSANPDGAHWGEETDYGDVTLGDVAPYTILDANGDEINFARWYYFFISIDASKTFGYPEDVNRGPTISDLSLFFTSDPNKRLRHGKTFTGGELQPLDTPCRQSNDADCPLP